MTQFTATYSKAQQFILIQAYADQFLTEEELMNFLLLEDEAGQPVIVTQTDIYLIAPDMDLDKFSHEKFSNAKWLLMPWKKQSKQVTLRHQEDTRKISFSFSTAEEAEELAQELGQLFGEVTAYGY